MRGFTFNTKQNRYYYDDTTGNIYPADENYDEEFYCGTTNEFTYELNDQDILNTILSNGLKSLILVVTESCNLRCKYCVYSKSYNNYRDHSNVHMRFETAKKAIDNYLDIMNSLSYSFPLTQPVISFYGGEPLMNYSLIKKTFEYIDNQYDCQVGYTLTTNGTLLTKEILEDLVKHNVLLLISLNGDKFEHDRLRVYENGQGTYDQVNYWVNFISENYPDYYEQYVLFSTVYDPKTNLAELEYYFENGIVKNKLFNLVPVMNEGTNWYNQFSKSELIAFRQKILNNLDINLNVIKASHKNETVNFNTFIKKLFSGDCINILGRTRNSAPSILGGSCIPGLKVAVIPNGDLHMCERCNMSYPIGNVDNWLDYKAIAKLIHEFNQTIRKKCGTCPISRLCPVCIKSGMTAEGKYDESLVNCDKIIYNSKIIMAQIYDYYESGLNPNSFVFDSSSTQMYQTIE